MLAPSFSLRVLVLSQIHLFLLFKLWIGKGILPKWAANLALKTFDDAPILLPRHSLVLLAETLFGLDSVVKYERHALEGNPPCL